ncbi:MAG: TnsA-like heteromeric transposase endonuclease subunit [Solirubrobacteraceae bacterium]
MTSAVGSEFDVTGPFEAGVRVGGEEVRGCLADLSLEVLRRCEPVRIPGVYQRQRHMPGRWFSTTVGRFLEYESLLERDWMLLLDFDREVEWICEQPLRLRYVSDGRRVSHVPDLLVWRLGAPEVCDVKSDERLDDPTFRAQVEATGLACAEAGIGYRVLSEPDQQLLANVRWLTGFRERPPDPDGERARMLARLATGSCTIAELVAVAREPMLARPVLMNLLWAGDALVDVSAPVGEDSVVRARLRVAR